jgi:hypothetical protein
LAPRWPRHVSALVPPRQQGKFAEESVGCEQRFSDQEIRAITEEIEAMRATIALTR